MKQILLVDDDVSFAELTQRRLSKHDMHVTIHAEPTRVIPLVSSGRFDLILLDLSMPGLSGGELLSVIKRFPSMNAPKVLLYSSADESALRKLAEEHGAGWLSKSASAGELVDAVRAALPDT